MSLTMNQVIKNRKKKKYIPRKNILEGPQRKGVCMSVSVQKPKKPNSASRKICKVRLSNKRIIKAFIPGETHNLQEHSYILVRYGKTQDLPGMKFKVIRGKYDTSGVEKRKNGRSKYGRKKEK